MFFSDEMGFSLSSVPSAFVSVISLCAREIGLFMKWCWPIIKQETRPKMNIFFFLLEIMQQQATVLSHGLLNLTKHKKCMYN